MFSVSVPMHVCSKTAEEVSGINLLHIFLVMLCFFFRHTFLYSTLESSSCVHTDDSNNSHVITFPGNKSFGLADKSQEVGGGTTPGRECAVLSAIISTIHRTFFRGICVGSYGWVGYVTRMGRQGCIQNFDWENSENLRLKREEE
jgi:hypothetical protein